MDLSFDTGIYNRSVCPKFLSLKTIIIDYYPLNTSVGSLIKIIFSDNFNNNYINYCFRKP